MLGKLLDKTANLLLTFAGILFMVILITIVSKIVARSFFNHSILWVADFSMLCISWLLMCGMAYGVHKSEHLAIDYLKLKLPIKVQRVLELVFSIIIAGFLLMLFFAGSATASVRMDMAFTSLRWPTGYAFMALPVFAFFSFIFTISRIVEIITKFINKDYKQAVDAHHIRCSVCCNQKTE